MSLARGAKFSARSWRPEIPWPDRPQTSHTLARSRKREREIGRKGMLIEMKGVEMEDWEGEEREAIGHTGEGGG